MNRLALTVVLFPLIVAASGRAELNTGFAPADESTVASAHGTRPHGVLLAALDTNKDGIISAAEIAFAPTVLRALDTNDDGVVSASELRRLSGSPKSHAAHATRADRVPAGFLVAFALDANNDGEIQSMEIANAVLSLKRLDQNGDGMLTSDEFRVVTWSSSLASNL